MSSNARGRNLLAGSVLALLAVGAAVWMLRKRDDAATQVPVATAKADDKSSAPAEAAPPNMSPREDDWRRKREQIRAAREERDAPVASPEPPTETDRCAEGCQGTLQLSLRLAAAVEGCAELLPEGASGEVRYAAHVLAEPGAGAIVDTVEVGDDELGSPAFNECMIESARLAELADPDQPVSDTFAFRWTAGAPRDNAVDFLGDHPELVSAHPELQALLDRPLDAPASNEDATTFARVVSTDEAATSAFLTWTAERGVDLSHVRVDD